MPNFTLRHNANLNVGGTSPETHHPGKCLSLQEQLHEIGRKTASKKDNFSTALQANSTWSKVRGPDVIATGQSFLRVARLCRPFLLCDRSMALEAIPSFVSAPPPLTTRGGGGGREPSSSLLPPRAVSLLLHHRPPSPARHRLAALCSLDLFPVRLLSSRRCYRRGGAVASASSSSSFGGGEEGEEEDEVERALGMDGSIPRSSQEFVRRVSSRAYDMRRNLMQSLDSISYDGIQIAQTPFPPSPSPSPVHKLRCF
ncbi:hypothetical protein B296_00026144 [Ensete ventricosum]|uniref:Uncharacterized protein n=1 Tax=Ensete ventricosum TaxID=4639 RepID=A0A427APH7_ENSVE|nr:hypothetical protein B296_00026144 [Ensete ventricosum]